MVSTSELKLMMTKMGTNMTDQELSDIIKESGASAKGISYPEFCKLMRVGGGRRRTRLSARDLEDQGEQEEDLRHAFSLFDRNRDGEIDAAEMTAALQMFGVSLTEREVAQLISEATLSSSRTVNFETFKRVMLAGQQS